MSIFFAILFILLLFVCWATVFFNLPGNWINILLLAIWKWFHPEMPAGWWFFIAILVLAAIAESLEFFSQIWGSRRYGGSKKASWGALIGAILGAIFGAPFLFGVGAVLGAVLGAFAGSLILELVSGRQLDEALRASKGAMYGRVLGFAAKGGLGMLILALSIPRVWP
ncbi:MAG: DUF456 domain-containing protein [Thermodesulfobacteriota bacterium]